MVNTFLGRVGNYFTRKFFMLRFLYDGDKVSETEEPAKRGRDRGGERKEGTEIKNPDSNQLMSTWAPESSLPTGRDKLPQISVIQREREKYGAINKLYKYMC
jgi:hypothetical protein